MKNLIDQKSKIKNYNLFNLILEDKLKIDTT